MENENKLKEEIEDIHFSKEISEWIQSSPIYDIDYCAHMEVEIEPEDAKNINEVKSFKVKRDIMGVEEILFTKKVED